MYKNKLRPTRWFYVLAFLIPIFACVATGLLVYRSVPKLPGAVEKIGIHNLTTVVVPGAKDVYFPKAGGYAVYYEYRSVIDGVNYVRDKYPPRLNCHLESKTSGKNIKLTRDYIEGNIYSTQNQERAGVLMMSISIDTPGVYKFSCQYPDGRTYPEIVLAVGPNIVWEFFNIAAKPVAAVVCGGYAFIAALVLSLLMAGIVAYMRYRASKVVEA
jgi:hypothetical protein